MEKEYPVRLIFHIGAGKTGSSSIQDTLRKNRVALKESGFLYLGQMLEHVPNPLYPWQAASGSESFHQLEPAAACEQLSAVLQAAFAFARRKGLHTLIWSNESFFGRDWKIRDALRALGAANVELKILAYVRRHDAWLRSAYVQWGIKHKGYAGAVKPFREWVAGRNREFAAALRDIDANYPGALILRNFDGVGDALADCLAVCGLEGLDLEPSRSNESPGGEELLLRALFNTRFEGNVLPRRFDAMFGQNLRFDTSPGDYLQRLLPSAQDLADVSASLAADRAALNEMLARHGQPPVDDSPLPSRAVECKTPELLMALSEIVMQQALRIERLEKLLLESAPAGGAARVR